MDSALWGLQAPRPPIKALGHAYYIRERYRVYGDYDRVCRSVSRLMGFGRLLGDELNSRLPSPPPLT
jgi:hypothetical protein